MVHHVINTSHNCSAVVLMSKSPEQGRAIHASRKILISKLNVDHQVTELDHSLQQANAGKLEWMIWACTGADKRNMPVKLPTATILVVEQL